MNSSGLRTAVILDRHPLWLEAMTRLLADIGVEVVGRTTNGDTVTSLLGEHRPDVFVAGIDPSDATEMDWVRFATQTYPRTKAIVVADASEPAAIDAAFQAGALVYCIKTAKQEDLASAVRQTFERSIYVAADSAFAVQQFARNVPAETVDHDLTRREVEILRLVSEGLSNSQLARMLWVTEQTVKFHLSNIYRKLRVANRTEASRWAQLHGLLAPEEEEAAVATG